ncbi:hypothetical protein AJ87_15100 [Rhizobium yanglingense]|nr:hypothetical protein AJ87_15100 [Rhizobium yanglingense]
MQKILVIEDQDLMRLALIQELKDCLTESVLLGAPTLDTAKTLMKSQDFDLVLIDPGLPGVNPSSRFDRLSIIEQVLRLPLQRDTWSSLDQIRLTSRPLPSIWRGWICEQDWTSTWTVG